MNYICADRGLGVGRHRAIAFRQPCIEFGEQAETACVAFDPVVPVAVLQLPLGHGFLPAQGNVAKRCSMPSSLQSKRKFSQSSMLSRKKTSVGLDTHAPLKRRMKTVTTL